MKFKRILAVVLSALMLTSMASFTVSAKDDAELTAAPLLELLVSSDDAQSAKLLKQFAENGGRMYCDGDVPTRIDAREADLSWLKPNMSFEELKGEQEVTIAKDGANISSVRSMTRKTENGRIIFVTNFTKNKFENVEITVKNCKNLDDVILRR